MIGIALRLAPPRKWTTFRCPLFAQGKKGRLFPQEKVRGEKSVRQMNIGLADRLEPLLEWSIFAAAKIGRSYAWFI